MKYKELQAVILAGGKGSRMTELTAGKAKCLLPIGNMPMIWYPLKLIQRSGFEEVIVVVCETMKNDVSSALDKLPLEIKIDLVALPNCEDLGTADSIRLIQEKIHKDIFVVSSDLIADLDVSEILNLHRKYDASVTALMLPMPSVPKDFVTPGPKDKQRPEIDLIGIDNESKRLVFLASASDFEETISLSKRLLGKHTNLTIHSRLLDAHLYIMKKWIIDYLVFNKSFGTLKGELLPYIVAKQLSRPPQQTCDEKNASIVKVNLKEDVYRFAEQEPLDALVQKMSAFNDHSTDLNDAYNGDIIRCYAHSISESVGFRANTLQMYHLANFKMADVLSSSEEKIPLRISPSATVKSTQMQDCSIDDNAFIDEKTSLKFSHIGAKVTVESKTRIAQSVLMENVVVKQRCVITNCILCNGCIIEEGTELKDCLVGAGHIVQANSRHSGEVLTEADIRLMEI